MATTERYCPYRVCKDTKGEEHHPIICYYGLRRRNSAPLTEAALTKHCETCGWYPPEEERRKTALRHGEPLLIKKKEEEGGDSPEVQPLPASTDRV